MDKNKFNKNLINKIKKEKIKQTPKYIFILRNIFVWFFLVVVIIFWALSLSISLDYLMNADWDLFRIVWLFKIFIVFIPIFWVTFLILSSIIWYYNYRHTDMGYKLSLLKIFIINILLSLILATLLYLTWVNNYIENKLENIIPEYRSVLVDDKISRMVKVWQNEDSWLLIWEILEFSKNELKFKDFNSKKWEIKLDDNTYIKHRVVIKVWEKIKIIWKKMDLNIFNALEIRPYIGKGK